IPAHLRLERDFKYPVVSNLWKNGAWQQETWPEQPLDEIPPKDGYWRVDTIRHDSYRMNVFFQGYWSDVRTFYKPLDNLRSVVVKLPHIKLDNLQFHLKLPNSNLVPLSVDQFKNFLYGDSTLKRKTLPGFPVGAHIEMVAVLRASAGQKH
ncbi:hypothetical protein PMAYCL1PPCAC_09422, partial [Pristionchus mayeri]